MTELDLDRRFRLAAFRHLARLTLGQDDIPVRWADLVSFEFDGRVAPLIGQSGIWRPHGLDLPISIATAPPRPGRRAPYEDEPRDDGTLIYRYRGTDPEHRDNRGLREAFRRGRPLIYFHGIEPGLYLACWPVRIVADDPRGLAVTVDLDAVAHGFETGDPGDRPAELRRAYRFAPARVRLHQAQFRTMVMRAYRTRCAICRLGHEDLLDAAHIIADREEEGVASLGNGLSLCKIHHAAFDRNIIGIDPRLVVHVREDILEEIDGPMLEHGLKETHGEKLRVIPAKVADRPATEILERRFETFRSAG